MQIAINRDWGGFELTDEQAQKYGKISGYQYDSIVINSIERDDSDLIQAINECPGGSVKVVEIPDVATDWTIINYDGMEYVMYVVDGKMHRTYR